MLFFTNLGSFVNIKKKIAKNNSATKKNVQPPVANIQVYYSVKMANKKINE